MGKITVQEESATPSTPSTGKWRLYFKSDGLYVIDDAGTETGPFGTGGGGGLPDGNYGDVTVSGGGTVITINNSVIDLSNFSSGVIDTDGTLAANSDLKIPTQKATKTYVDNAITGLLDFKGSTNCSANPNYPAGLKGDAYVVSAAGKIGGASGKSVDTSDVYLAIADNAGGTEAAVGSSWIVLEHNLVGALLSANNLSDVSSPSSARSNLGLSIGVDVQAFSSVLSTLAGASANGQSLVTAINYAAMRTLLGLVIGSDVQAYDANLAAIAGLTSAANKIIYFTGSGTAGLLDLDTDGTLSSNSDTKVPSQKAVKTYVNATAASKIVQEQYYSTGAVSTGTTTIPSDDTIPQITEGNEYMTLAITPTNVSNILDVEVVWQGTSTVATYLAVALFQDAISNALAVAFSYTASGANLVISFRYRMVAGTTSSTTFRVRAGGGAAGTTTFNGYTSNRKYGGVLVSSIKITESLP